jgi:hypothetical protein
LIDQRNSLDAPLKAWHERELAKARPVDATAAEIYHYYWETDEKSAEIARAFGLATVGEHGMLVSLTRIVGRYPLLPCSCGQTIFATSRSDRRQILYSFDRGLHELCWDCHRKWESVKRRESMRACREEEERRQSLHHMSYAAYLRTSEWIERANRAKKRAGYRCQVCNGRGKVNVHHRTYERRGHEWDEDLIVLCATCHQMFHREGKLAPEPTEETTPGPAIVARYGLQCGNE